jgi:ribose 5-phosphate isomerase A
MEEKDTELSKKTAAGMAAEFARDGMVVGLGTGSTAEYAIKGLAGKKLDIVGVPTSRRTEELAGRLGIRLARVEDCDRIDIDLDGADEVDPDFNLIKGGGGAHTREKRVAERSDRFVVMVDHTKLVKRIGKFPVAVEVEPSKTDSVKEGLRDLGGIPRVRGNFVTDNGNIIIDTKFDITDPAEMEERLNSIPGVVENGIFSKRRPDIVIVGYGKEVKILRQKNER